MEHLVNHFNNLPQEEQLIIKHYTHEIDIDDWKDCPLLISYEVVNYILKQYHFTRNELKYTPELLQHSVISIADMQLQIENAKKLQAILHKFPFVSYDVNLYRGFISEDIVFQKSKHLRKDDEIIIPYFLSTTLNFAVAERFTNKNKDKCFWNIIIPKGFPVPLLNIAKETENEVIINIGAILQCLGCTTYQDGKCIISFILTSFSKSVSTRGYWKYISQIAFNNII